MEILSKVLEEDVKFNAVNLQQKIQERPQKLHQWLSRLRNKQQELLQLEEDGEALMADLMTEAESNSRVTLSQIALKKHVENHASYKSHNRALKNMKLDIEYISMAVDTLKWIGQDHGRLVEMLKLEKI